MNFTVQTCIFILIAHWVGDYLLQTNTIAVHKSNSRRWLFLHVLIYTAVLFVASLFLFSWIDAIRFCAVNGFLHYITDYCTSRLSARYKNNPRIFYPILGFDQLVHTITLMVTISAVDRDFGI